MKRLLCGRNGDPASHDSRLAIIPCPLHQKRVPAQGLDDSTDSFRPQNVSHPPPCRPCPIPLSPLVHITTPGMATLDEPTNRRTDEPMNPYNAPPRRLTMILQNLVSDPAPRLTTCLPPSLKNLSTTKSSATVRWCVPTLMSGGFRGVTPRLGPAPAPAPNPDPAPNPVPEPSPNRDAPVGRGRGGL